MTRARRKAPTRRDTPHVPRRLSAERRAGRDLGRSAGTIPSALVLDAANPSATPCKPYPSDSNRPGSWLRGRTLSHLRTCCKTGSSRCEARHVCSCAMGQTQHHPQPFNL